jgi:hypothetical protein
MLGTRFFFETFKFLILTRIQNVIQKGNTKIFPFSRNNRKGLGEALFKKGWLN